MAIPIILLESCGFYKDENAIFYEKATDRSPYRTPATNATEVFRKVTLV